MESAWVQGGDGWTATPPDGLLALLAAPEPPAAWVHVDSVDHLAEAARQAGLPESVVRRAVEGGLSDDPRHPQVRKLPGGGQYLVSPTLAYDGRTRDVTTGLWAALVVDDVTITAEEGGTGLLDDVLEHLADAERLPQDSTHQVFAAALMALVHRASAVEVGIGEAVADVEQQVFTPGTPDPAEVVYDLKREIAEARRALVPLLAVLPELISEEEDARRETRTMRWLRRLDTALGKVDRHLDGHDALLGDMLSVHLSRVSVRQNEDMRKISAWAAIIAVPTLVAGIYGMNFDHMPELHWLAGYPLALVLMAGAATVLFRLFKRSRWL
ncbi:CorA family divalent cation transporter [Cellulomonas triticagri]|uniref:CorA family divalent cation transporter n=1 Tax=Cellulomonas triticagri TaxID=2483352 RepID=UPI001315A87A|nr:CorA family divalent cation transporter [Cellulomonas triticagri]